MGLRHIGAIAPVMLALVCKDAPPSLRHGTRLFPHRSPRRFFCTGFRIVKERSRRVSPAIPYRLTPGASPARKQYGIGGASLPALRLDGGAKEDRTPDLLRARQALSQLSYGPGVRVAGAGQAALCGGGPGRI
jgi:hypothetical protein